jgi:hypothetical protein
MRLAITGDYVSELALYLKRICLSMSVTQREEERVEIWGLTSSTTFWGRIVSLRFAKLIPTTCNR